MVMLIYVDVQTVRKKWVLTSLLLRATPAIFFFIIGHISTEVGGCRG